MECEKLAESNISETNDKGHRSDQAVANTSICVLNMFLASS